MHSSSVLRGRAEIPDVARLKVVRSPFACRIVTVVAARVLSRRKPFRSRASMKAPAITPGSSCIDTPAMPLQIGQLFDSYFLSQTVPENFFPRISLIEFESRQFFPASERIRDVVLKN